MHNLKKKIKPQIFEFLSKNFELGEEVEVGKW